MNKVIFLAHATEDKPQVRKLRRKLKAAGFIAWLDEVDLLPGQNWQIEIPRAIKQSAIFIACFSKRSILKQGYVQKEFRLALNAYAERPLGSIFLIPLRLDDCELPDLQIPDLSINISDIQWLDYWKRGGDKRLLTAIRKAIPEAISSNVIDFAEVVKRKRAKTGKTSRPAANKRATNSITIGGDVRGGIVANNVNLSGTKSQRMHYPAGSVGANLHKYNYLADLISQYFEFRKADSSYDSGHARRFHPAELHRSIRSKFKAKTYFVPEELWEKECLYVKQRIDKTILGKNNKARGIRNYESFEEFLWKQK